MTGTPPHDLDAEKVVLGALMSGATPDDIRPLRPADFYRPAHQLIAEAIEALTGSGKPADAVAVLDELRRRRQLTKMQGGPYLHTCIAAVPSPAQAGYYAAIVREHAERRGWQEHASRLAELAGDPGSELENIRLLAASPPGIGAGRLGRLDELRAMLLDSQALDTLPVPAPLIEGLLYRDSLAWLHGKPGHGKSLLALDWACCIAAAMPWLGRKVSGGPVLYVIAEGATGLRPRVRAWEDRAGQKSQVRFLPVAVQMLQQQESVAVAALAAELGAVLVVLDTQARVTVGAEENSAVDMGRLVEAAERIRAASGACVQFVHHESRAAEHMRGSTALEGAANTILRVVKDGPRLELTNPKQKDAAEADPVTLWVVQHQRSVVIAGHPNTPTLELRSASESKIIETLLESFGSTGASATALRSATGLAESTFHWALNRLVTDGKVQNMGTRTRTCYVPAQDQLPAGTPTTPTGSNSNYSNSNPHKERMGVGGVESLEPPDGGWPADSIGAEANR